MKVIGLTLGILATNTYIAYNESNMEGIVVDPADKAERIIEVLNSKGITLKAIFLTHGHFDHIGAAGELREKMGVKIYVMEEERQILETEKNLSSMIRKNITLSADEYLHDKQIIKLLGYDIKVIHTPGHTIGSCCYYFESEGVLFSGDTMFAGTYGRTDFPTGSTSSIIRSITEKLLVLPENVNVYPGHNEETTIGFERQNYDIYQI